jgi:hypothetical protein
MYENSQPYGFLSSQTLKYEQVLLLQTKCNNSPWGHWLALRYYVIKYLSVYKNSHQYGFVSSQTLKYEQVLLLQTKCWLDR